MKSSKGFALSLAMAVIGIVTGIIAWTGTHITKAQIEKYTVKEHAVSLAQQECFDKEGNPRGPEYCKSLNTYLDSVLIKHIKTTKAPKAGV